MLFSRSSDETSLSMPDREVQAARDKQPKAQSIDRPTTPRVEFDTRRRKSRLPPGFGYENPWQVPSELQEGAINFHGQCKTDVAMVALVVSRIHVMKAVDSARHLSAGRSERRKRIRETMAKSRCSVLT